MQASITPPSKTLTHLLGRKDPIDQRLQARLRNVVRRHHGNYLVDCAGVALRFANDVPMRQTPPETMLIPTYAPISTKESPGQP